MSDADVQRDLGRMEAQIAALTRTVEALDRKVDTITDTLAQATGGWRSLMWVAGASAALGGLIAKLAPFLSGPKP